MTIETEVKMKLGSRKFNQPQKEYSFYFYSWERVPECFQTQIPRAFYQ